MEDGRVVEVSLIGNEGISGIGGILGAKRYQYTAVAVAPGSCLRMRMDRFEDEFARGKELRLHVLNYLGHLLVQVSQTAACNRLHRVRQRFARRLLMIQDRLGGSEFAMTHESLADALGTPRSEVSFAADVLRHFGVINYSRGKIEILDREKLEAASCECYGVIHREFLRLN